MAKNRIPDHIVEELSRVGAVILETGMGGKHPFVRFQFLGLVRKKTFPGSASDHRSMMNNRTELKRLIREMQEEAAKQKIQRKVA